MVRVAPLDELLTEAGFDGRTIHFCSIDVEGSEAAALAGFDLTRWQPWLLVVEATEPNTPTPSHGSWEESVLRAGYRFWLFDGLNRFYVHPDKADEFAQFAYPACVFDAPFERVVSALRAREPKYAALEKSRRAEELERERAALVARAADATAEAEAMRATISWRVTRPLRSASSMKRTLLARLASARPATADGHLATTRRELELAFARRILQASHTLCPEAENDSEPVLEKALAALEEAVTSSTAPDTAKAWLSYVVVDGSFPDERSVERFARVLRMEGAAGLRNEVLRSFATSVEQGLATTGELDVRRSRILVDVTHTAMASDLHTGIQRVVRETVGRWIEGDCPMDLIRFDLQPPAARTLSAEEAERFGSWRTYVGSVAAAPPAVTDGASPVTVVPWQCDLLVPELPFETERTAAYRGLGAASVLRSLSMVGYDVIPIVAAEKVLPHVTTDFGGYLSVVKHADRVSTISRTSRDSFEAFAAMAAAEGLRPPRIAAHELPAEPPRLDERAIEAARAELGVDNGPLVVVVGSHEPRKNHVAVLEAAERLWERDSRAFELLFVGWSGWLGEEFEELVGKLIAAGRPIIIRKRCSEEELWAAYRLARFSVFPSLLEGYGLPIAESLLSGTPVITSDYGSMAEVAEKGGCLLVDPRKVDELEHAMSLLLADDELLGKLREEARGVDLGTWESYAEELWRFFTEAGG